MKRADVMLQIIEELRARGHKTALHAQGAGVAVAVLEELGLLTWDNAAGGTEIAASPE